MSAAFYVAFLGVPGAAAAFLWVPSQCTTGVLVPLSCPREGILPEFTSDSTTAVACTAVLYYTYRLQPYRLQITAVACTEGNIVTPRHASSAGQASDLLLKTAAAIAAAAAVDDLRGQTPADRRASKRTRREYFFQLC